MGCFEYVQKNLWKLIITSLIFLNFIVYSIRSTSTGIALLDLQIQVQETFTVTSRLVTAYSVGYLIGGCSIGFVEGICHNFILLAITGILGGISLGFVPQFTQILIIFPLIGISGFMNAISETLSNVALVDIWGIEVGNYMQLLYFSYGIGGLLTPILIRPFQLPIPEEAGDDPDAYLAFYKPEEVQILCPYLWITGASIFTGTLFIICYLVEQRNRKLNENKKVEEIDIQISEEKVPSENDSPSKFKIAIAVGWVTAVCHIGSAMHLILSCFAQAYGVKSVFKMEKKKAALLSGVYWLVYCAGKIIFVSLSALIGEKSVIYGISILYFIGIVLAFTLANSIEFCLWTIPVFYALGVSPFFNYAIADLENYFHLTGRYTSIIFIGVCIGESIHVPIVGTFLDDWPDIYLYYTGTLSALFLAGFLVMPFICRSLFKKSENSKTQESDMERKVSRFGSLIVPVPERRDSIMSLAVSSSDCGKRKSNA